MKTSEGANTWLGSRQYRMLWGCIPVILAFLAWLGFGFCLASWTPAGIRARYVTIAKNALAAKDFETARVANLRLVRMGGERQQQYLFELAIAFGGLGKRAEASGLMAVVAPIEKPGYPPAHMFLAVSLMTATNVQPQMIKMAETHLKRVLAVEPQSIEANDLLASLYLQARDWESAKKHLMQVAGARPDAPLLASETFKAEGDVAAGQVWAGRAARVYRAPLLLAAVAKAQGDNAATQVWAERAARFYRMQVEGAKEDDPASRLGWANSMMMMNNFAEAFSILEAGWKKSGDKVYETPMAEVSAMWARAVAKDKPEDIASRVKLLQQGLQYSPQNMMLLTDLIDVSHMKAPESEAARRALDKMLAEGSASAILHLTLGADAWQRGQLETARKHFALSYELAPQMSYVANNMALILAVGSKPDLPRAMGIIQSVLEKFPNDPDFRETRGQILVKSRRWQEAVADLEFALPMLQSKRMTHEALAEAYRNLGMQNIASEHERLAKQEPAKADAGTGQVPNRK